MPRKHARGKAADPVAQRPGRSPGAPPSNTAPANYKPDEITRFLRVGIDSLYLSYTGKLHLGTETKLKAIKLLAQGPPHQRALAVYPVSEHRFEVRDKGAGPFFYVLIDNACRIQLSGLKARSLPLGYVQAKSAWLLAKGVENAVAELTEIVSQLGQVEGEPTVSRADLYVDFTVNWAFGIALTDQWITRARRITTHTLDKAFSGFSIGLGGDISARLYDKTREIEASGKGYLKDIWRVCGWDGEATVYRLEFQIERRVLGEHGVRILADLQQRTGPLWRYATLNWLKLVVPSQHDANPTRWPLHPVWAALAQVDWPGSQEGLSLPLRLDRGPSEEKLYIYGLGWIASFMACHGITDSREAFRLFEEAARQFINAKRDRIEIDFEGYLFEKAALKARKFNLPYPDIDERREKAIRPAYAAAYRKAKDGE